MQRLEVRFRPLAVASRMCLAAHTFRHGGKKAQESAQTYPFMSAPVQSYAASGHLDRFLMPQASFLVVTRLIFAGFLLTLHAAAQRYELVQLGFILQDLTRFDDVIPAMQLKRAEGDSPRNGGMGA